jgi:hypothetical protein
MKSKYEGNIPILQRIEQLERQHDVQRPSFYGAHWRESLDICNTLAEQNKRMLAMLKEIDAAYISGEDDTYVSILRMRVLIKGVEETDNAKTD